MPALPRLRDGMSVGCAVRPHRGNGARTARSARIATDAYRTQLRFYPAFPSSEPSQSVGRAIAPVPTNRPATFDPPATAEEIARDGIDAAADSRAFLSTYGEHSSRHRQTARQSRHAQRLRDAVALRGRERSHGPRAPTQRLRN